MTTATRLGIASGTKGVTALDVMQLVTEGALSPRRPRRVTCSARDLPLVDDRVTVEHLLTHRSGIGDYVDEEAFPDTTDHVLTVPVPHPDDDRGLPGGARRASPRCSSRASAAPTTTAPSSCSRSSRGGWPAGPSRSSSSSACAGRRACRASAFLRSDELPADAAIGYLWHDRPRTNVMHLPVVGSGDGRPVHDDRRRRRASGAPWSRAPHPARRGRGRHGDGAQHRVPDGTATAWGSGSARRTAWSPSSGATPGSRSAASTTADTDLTWTVVSNTSEGAWPRRSRPAEHLSA